MAINEVELTCGISPMLYWQSFLLPSQGRTHDLQYETAIGKVVSRVHYYAGQTFKTILWTVFAKMLLISFWKYKEMIAYWILMTAKVIPSDLCLSNSKVVL